MSNRDSVGLVKKAIGGDQAAFGELMKIKRKDIYYVAAGILRNYHDAEDAAQEAILLIHKNISSLNNASVFDVWMHRIVFNVCMNLRRSSKKVTPDPTAVESAAEALEDRHEFLPAAFFEDEERKRQLVDAIWSLPDKYRICLLYCYYEEMSYAQIAATLDTSEQAIANRLNRARKKLKLALEQSTAQEEAPADTRPLVPRLTAEALASAPIITAVLKEDALRVYTKKTDERLMSAISKALSNPTASSVPMSQMGGVVSTAKIAGGVVSAVLLGTSILAGVVALSSSSGVAQPSQDVSVAKTTWGSAQAVLSSNLEDIAEVIGESAAKTLVSYATTTVDKKTWERFVDSEYITFVSNITTADHTYSTYISQKGSTRLIIIVRIDNEGTVEVAYRAAKGMPLPKEFEIITAFEAWK